MTDTLSRTVPERKECVRCHEVKLSSEFRRTETMRSGLYSYCKPCEREKAREWQRENPEKRAAIEARRKPRSSESRRASVLRREYGLTPADYERMLEEQHGTCGICGTSDPGYGRVIFFVDHDHKTGAVRGLLCGACNLGLGKLKDDPIVVQAALNYLLAHKINSP